MTTESRLRTLVALAATGSVRGAARRLTVTESAVSASIGALARGLGVPLVEPVRGRLRLAAVTTAGEHLMPALLAEFRRQHPGIALALEVAPSAQVWDLVGAHEVDLVIAGAPPSGVEAWVVATKPNELIVVAAPPVAESFNWTSTPWLLREQGSATRIRVESYLKAQHVAPP